MSKIEDAVAKKILLRAKIGEKKYRTTMERNDLSLQQWLQHLQEELMDACVYVEKLKQEVEYQEFELKAPEAGPCSSHQIDLEWEEEQRERRMRVIGQNGNDGLHYGKEDDGTGYVNYPSDELDYLASKTNWANKKEVQKYQQTTTLYPGDIIVTYDEIQTEKGKENS